MDNRLAYMDRMKRQAIRYYLSLGKHTVVALSPAFSDMRLVIIQIFPLQVSYAANKYNFVFDTLTQRILWKWMTEEEIKEMRKNKVSLSMVRRDSKGKIKRKS